MNAMMPGTIWKGAGPTYYPAFGNPTTPDHWLVPRELGGSIYRLMALWRAARKLQLIPDRCARDHMPVLLSFTYDFGNDTHAQAGERWDYDKLGMAVQAGIGRREFLLDLAAELLAKK